MIFCLQDVTKAYEVIEQSVRKKSKIEDQTPEDTQSRGHREERRANEKDKKNNQKSVRNRGAYCPHSEKGKCFSKRK